MKSIYLATLFTLTSFLSVAQSGITFECNNYEFTVYQDDTPLKFSYKIGDDISYDYYGRVIKIGDINISNDYYGRVEKIGGMRIERDYYGKVTGIGGMSITYDYYGRMTGSSGSLNCDL